MLGSLKVPLPVRPPGAHPSYLTLSDLPVFDIEARGAVAGDQSVDNIDVIQSCIDAATAAGGGVVDVPPGKTFYIAPSGTTRYIVAKSNATLRIGAGAKIKVKDNAGNYERLIGSDAAVTDFTVLGPGSIDQNPVGNTTCDIRSSGGTTSQVLIAMRFSNVAGLTVRDVRFDRCCGVNTVWVSGFGCKDVVVEGCLFKFRKGASGVATFYDNSAVYLEAPGSTVIRNRFLVDDSAGPYYQQYANGAIEIHAPGAVVANNYVDGYAAFLHIVTPFDSRMTSDVTTDSYDVTVTGNTARRINWGVDLLAGDTTTPAVVHAAMRGVTITGNTFEIHQLEHNRGQCYAFYIAGAANSPIENVTFEGNTARFQAGDNRTNDQWGVPIQTITSGVYCFSLGLVRNLKVLGNTIVNAPWQGIGFGPTTGEAITIEHNTVVDCGVDANHPFPIYRAGISVGFGGAPVLTDVTVQHNTIRDTGATLNGLYAIAASATTATRCRLGPNVIRSTAANFPSFINRAGLTWDEAGGMSADRGDSNVTLVTGTDLEVQRFATTLTANRTVTLSSNMAGNGSRFRIVRTGLGAFTLDVGGLKTIPSGTAAWVDVLHDGTAWRLAGYGTL